MYFPLLQDSMCMADSLHMCWHYNLSDPFCNSLQYRALSLVSPFITFAPTREELYLSVCSIKVQSIAQLRIIAFMFLCPSDMCNAFSTVSQALLWGISRDNSEQPLEPIFCDLKSNERIYCILQYCIVTTSYSHHFTGG